MYSDKNLHVMKTLNIDYTLPNLQKIENLNPNDYEIIGMVWKEYQGEEEGVTFEIDFSNDYDFNEFYDSKMCEDIFKIAQAKTSRCNHCNKMIQYLMIGLNKVNGTINIFGHKCTENISMYQGMSFEYINKRSLSSFVKLKNEAKRDKFLEEHVGLREALDFKHPLIENIRDYFYKYFTLSEKQIDLVYKSIEKQKEFDLKNSLRESEAKDVPVERVKEQLFKIISVKRAVDYFGGNETINLKTCLEHVEDKYRVYGNLPSSYLELFDSGLVTVGMELILTATLSQSDKNTKFGYFKRAVGTKN